MDRGNHNRGKFLPKFADEDPVNDVAGSTRQLAAQPWVFSSRSPSNNFLVTLFR